MNKFIVSIVVIFYATQVIGVPVVRRNFFKDVMGVNEAIFLLSSPDKVAKYIKRGTNSAGKPVYFLNSFQAGFFDTRSIGQLREESHDLPMLGNGTFSVIVGGDPVLRNRVDVGANQANVVNNDAVFQIASNFNALEMVSKDNLLERGIEEYCDDWTQGPFASISATPGLIYRAYYLFYDPTTDPLAWRQTCGCQLNLLEKLPLRVTNGYLDLSEVKFEKDVPVLTERDKENILVGVHRDIQVTHGFVLNPCDNHERLDKKDQVVSQVFTAALDLGNANRHLKDSPRAQLLAQDLLNAAYEGTLRAAFVEGKKKVFLTLVGGGVFANDLAWIVQAIEKDKGFIRDSGLQVTLIVYKSDEKYKKVSQWLRTIVNDLQGTYQDHSRV
jgi:hypothetical protein